MPRSILALFSGSPWGAVQEHMRTVNQCVQLLDPLMDAVMAGNRDRTEQLAKEISSLENGADQIKNELRDHLPAASFYLLRAKTCSTSSPCRTVLQTLPRMSA
jgi:hypothetical protein